jgi:hypothetical protein
MPKLYEYLGIIIMFYSNEHEPIHVHGKHDGRECKAEIVVQNGIVVRVNFKPVGAGLEPGKQQEFETFIRANASEIVRKWIDFFVYKKSVHSQTITRKI